MSPGVQFRPQSLPDNTSDMGAAIRHFNQRLREVSQALSTYPARALERGVVDTSYDVGHVKRYGAVGTGEDATIATRAALAALQVVPGYNALVFDPGTYLLSAEILGISDIDVVRWGATITSATRFQSHFNFTGCTNVQFFGGTIDQGQPVLPTYTEYDTLYNVGVYLYQSSNIRFVCCTFTNLYTRAIYALNCSGYLKIIGCVFTSPAQNQGLMAEHISIASSSCDVTIDEFTVENDRPIDHSLGVCAVAMANTTGRISITNYHLNYCGRSPAHLHPLLAFSCYKDCVDVTIANGVSKNTLAGFVRLSDTGRAEVSRFYVDHSDLATPNQQVFTVESFGNDFGIPGEQSGCQHIHIHSGIVRDDYSAVRVGLASNAYDWAVPQTDINYHDIDWINMYTAVQLGGPFQRLNVERMNISGANGGRIIYTIDVPGVPVTAGLGVAEVDSVCSDLTIKDNTQDVGVNSLTPIEIDFTSTHSYTGTIKGTIKVENPTARTTAANAPFLKYRGIAGKGRLKITGADADTYTTAFDIANVSELTLLENAIRNIPAANFLVTSGTIGVLRRHDNTLSAGPDSGTATLTAGTVTVATAEAQAGDRVLLNHQTAGGTLGQLSYTITPGVSIVITSTNAADTSTVAWKIDH